MSGQNHATSDFGEEGIRSWVLNRETTIPLIPWVRVKNLASHVLGQAARRVKDDWLKQWDYSPEGESRDIIPISGRSMTIIDIMSPEFADIMSPEFAKTLK